MIINYVKHVKLANRLDVTYMLLACYLHVTYMLVVTSLTCLLIMLNTY